MSKVAVMNALDEKIYALSYDPKKILSFNGENMESFIPNEGIKTPDKFIVIKREKKSISDNNADIAIIDSLNNRIFPGAIQLANRNLVENRPDLVSCDRKPIVLSIDLPGMGSESKVVVDSPSNSSISSAISSLLNTWNSKYSSTNKIPSRIQYNESMVYSESQISTKFGLNFKSLGKSLDIDFNGIFEGKKKAMVISFKQIFYNVSVDAPKSPSDFFGDNVSWDELTLKGMNNNNPPAYVSNVSYGRTVFVKLETTSTSSDVESAFKALIKEQNAEANVKYKEIFENSTFTAVVIGGGAQEHNKVVSKNFDEIRDVIMNNSEYSPTNPGLPISYTSVFLKDNAIATINSNSEYVKTTSTEYTNGKIVLNHTGGYVAQFNISWDELTYDKNGKEVLTRKYWSENNRDKTSPFNTTIHLSGNCKNIDIHIKEATGLAWEWWRTLVNVKNTSLLKERKIDIYGTTLIPYVNITPDF